MDVNTAFVNSDLDRDNVFFNLPDGYAVHDDAGNDISSEYVLHGKRALYGLPQAPRLWGIPVPLRAEADPDSGYNVRWPEPAPA